MHRVPETKQESNDNSSNVQGEVSPPLPHDQGRKRKQAESQSDSRKFFKVSPTDSEFNRQQIHALLIRTALKV